MKTLLLTLFVSAPAFASSGGGAGGAYSTCLQTCMGCCRGETCEPGTADQACGRNVCSVCVEGDACQEPPANRFEVAAAPRLMRRWCDDGALAEVLQSRCDVRPVRLVFGCLLLLCSPLLAFEFAVYALSHELPRPEPIAETTPALFVDALWLVEDGPPSTGVEFWWLGNLRSRPAGSAACLTIARQVLRRSTEHHFRTLEQHARELALAVRLCRHTSVDELKQVLAHQCYFGREAIGPHAAAEAWFQKSPEALGVAETATLAGLPRTPSLSASRLRARRDFVLTKMAKEGLISRREEAEAKAAPTE